jgi:hypothetical protein
MGPQYAGRYIEVAALLSYILSMLSSTHFNEISIRSPRVLRPKTFAALDCKVEVQFDGATFEEGIAIFVPIGTAGLTAIRSNE